MYSLPAALWGVRADVCYTSSISMVHLLTVIRDKYSFRVLGNYCFYSVGGKVDLVIV